MKHMTRLMLLFFVAVMTASCASFAHKERIPMHESAQYYNYILPSFSEYLSETESWLSQNRRYISSDRQKELAMNMPFELPPKGKTNKAILLVHGLGDSPYSFSDLGNSYVDQGFHVQALLLPGHGSKPEDLMLPTYLDWQKIVDHYANLLKEDFDEVWLGGFSTGANLITIHALEHGGVAGLMLVSPGFQSKAPFLEKLAPIAALFTDGYQVPESNLARYNSAPINGGMAYSESAEVLRDRLERKRVTIPTLLILAEADSVVDPFVVKNMFEDRFSHSRNTLIWYGESLAHNHGVNKEMVIAKTMKLAEHRISTASHMSPLFAPSNHYYGEQGEKIMCMNSFSKAHVRRCEDGELVWFSAWGYEEEGKIHARLTWNPYFSELNEAITQVTSIVKAQGS